MSTTGKEYKLAIRIAGIIDKSFDVSLVAANTSLKKTFAAMDKDFTFLDKGYSKVMNVGKKCFSAIATAAGVAATAVGAVTASSISVGSEFEAQMSTVKAISGATADELESMSKRARELASSSVFSAKEVGNAMEYMGMAGWKTEDILTGIEGVLNLAAASGEDFSLVSDIVTDDLTAFNMTASETERMVNVMAQAAMNSNTDVELMGEAFKYAGAVAGAMGYQIEDIAIATGLMASAGIKGSMAGTTLRTTITRMAKPTKESAEAMNKLGLSLEKSDGSMYSFMEIMQNLRKNMSSLTETEKAYYAAQLGGQRGMTGVLAIANASEEEFTKLADAIYQAEGAAEKMASIRLDNLSGDVQIFKDAVSDAGIELYYQFNEQLRGIVQTGTQFIEAAKVKIPEAYDAISSKFPTLYRKFKKYGKPVFEGIVNTGKWVVKHGDGIISVIAGIGAAMITYKLVSNGIHLVKTLTTLANMNPFTWGALGAVGVIGAITTAIVAFMKHQDALADESLAEHFGNIALSMEEIQQVADHIVSSESIGGVKKALEAFEDLDLISGTIEDAISEIDKMNWKVSIGMELTEDEQETYKKDIYEFVKNAQEYVLQSQYASTLNLSNMLGDSPEGESLKAKVDAFFQGAYDEMVSLGTQMSEVVNEAFSDGILDPDEVNAIADVQAKMAEVQKQLAMGELEGQLSALGMNYANGEALDSESFLNLMNQVNESISAAKQDYTDSYAKNYALLMQSGASEEEFAALSESYRRELSNLDLKAASFGIDTVMNSYSDEMIGNISAIQEAIGPALDELMSAGYTTPEEWSQGLQYALYGVESGIDIDKDDRLALGKLYDALQPQLVNMKELAAEYTAAGEEIPKEIASAIDNIYAIGAVSGDEGALWEMFGTQISNNEEYATLLALCKEAGSNIPQEILDAMTDDGVMADIDANVNYILESIKTGLAEGVEITIPVYYDLAAYGIKSKNAGISASDININALRSADEINDYINHRASGGLATSPELTWFAENGPEMAIPIDGSRNAISLWEQTGRLLGMDSALDGLALDGGGSGPTIEYKPTLQFYGDSPSRDDLVDAMEISQDKFDRLMDRYFKTRGRVSFG